MRAVPTPLQELSPEQRKIRKSLFKPCKAREELQTWVHFFLDLELPGIQVDEDSNSSPLDMVWEVYNRLVNPGAEDISRVLYYSGRSAGKSLSESVIEVLLLLHFRGKIIHLAAIKEQSKNVQDYIKGFFHKPHLQGWVTLDNVETTEVSFYVPFNKNGYVLKDKEYKKLPEAEKANYEFVENSCKVIVATMQSVNGKHGVLIMDELDVMSDRRVYEEAKNIPDGVKRADGTLVDPVTVLTSTRKSNGGIVQDEIDNAEKTGLIIRHWNTLDVTQKCPPERHCPEKEKITIYRSDQTLSAISEENYKSLPEKDQEHYVKDEGFWGCYNQCKMFAFCRGRLATRQTSTSKFLKPLSHIEKKFRENTLEMFKAQHLCWKPGSEGAVYPRLDKQKHVITPAKAYFKIFDEEVDKNFSKAALIDALKEKAEFIGGMDFGFSHYFACVIFAVANNIAYVLMVEAAAELDPNQQVEQMTPYMYLEPKIFPDMEDPKMIKLFQRNGFHMKNWNKGKASVVGGINVVKMKLNPAGGEPELFFVRDIGEDPNMDLLVKHLIEHKWKLDGAGRPTNQVEDENKDLPDALRYGIMNKFDPKGRFNVTNSYVPKPVDHYAQEGYTEENWMQKTLLEKTGFTYVPGQSAQASWYAQKLEEEQKGKKGKKKGVVWNFS